MEQNVCHVSKAFCGAIRGSAGISSTDIVPFSAEEHEAINQRLVVLRPFHQAAVECCGNQTAVE